MKLFDNPTSNFDALHQHFNFEVSKIVRFLNLSAGVNYCLGNSECVRSIWKTAHISDSTKLHINVHLKHFEIWAY